MDYSMWGHKESDTTEHAQMHRGVNEPRDCHTKSEKQKYCILMHIGGIYKNGIDDLICKTEIETHM